MFHRYGKKTQAHAKSLKDLTKIQTAEHILAEEKRQQLLAQIEEFTVLEALRYDSLCLSHLHLFTNHCQLLPDTLNSYYSQPGGLLDRALNRTEAALGLFKNFMIQDENKEYSEEQKLWQYVLFSSGLLQGVGKLVSDLSVDLYDANGQFLKQWNPLLENLVLFGSHYAYTFLKEGEADFRRRLNVLLAKQLIPNSGFAWIVSQREVLEVWLALLNEDLYSAGTLGAILIRADAIALQRYFNQFAAKHYGSRGSRFNRVSTFSGGAESISNIEQLIGIEFIQWINKALAEGRFVINKAPLLLVPGGLLMCPEIFRLFMKDHPEFKNMQAIIKGLLSLGLHRAHADAHEFRFEDAKTQQVHSGIVINNPSVFMPDSVQVLALNSGMTNTISSIELITHAETNNLVSQHGQQEEIALPVLDYKGEWQSAEKLITHSAPSHSMPNR